ncbi:hypothetical protein H8E07_17085 [bacterium]|nr:hypothetical protein [bacterium]
MTRAKGFFKWFRSPVNLVAGSLVVGGFLLTEIDWGYLALCALGTFGPGILRELGWLKDKDELELQAARRAGYHAYLVGGLMVFLLVAMFRHLEGPTEAPTPLDHPSMLVTSILVVMWFTWLLSSLLSYWGALKSARRILYAFGVVWLIFNILAGEGDWKTSAMQSLLAVPFFAMAWAAPRWPRVAGVLLLAVSAYLFWFLGFFKIFTDPLGMGRSVVVVLFLGPLVASGLALLKASTEDDSQEAI